MERKTGGSQIADWAFGLVDAERKPKPAYATIQRQYTMPLPPREPGGRLDSGEGWRIQYWRMSHTITVRLTKELAAWLEQVARKSGVPQGRIVRDQLEKAKASSARQSFMRLAGSTRGPRELSSRKGFSRS